MPIKLGNTYATHRPDAGAERVDIQTLPGALDDQHHPD